MSDVVLPEGSLIKVEMTVRLPASATEDQVAEWIESEVGQSGGVALDNPLSSHSPEAWGAFGVDWEDTGEVGWKVEFDHETVAPGHTRYKVRYLRESRS